MIVSLTLRNSEHVHQMFRCYPQPLYGLALPYAADCAYSGLLAQGEDLFICAHGSPKDIGHPEGYPRLSPGELADWLIQSVLPCHYAGRIYIAAPGSGSGFIDNLIDCMGAEYHGRIFGAFALAYNQISPPGSEDWVAAIPGLTSPATITPASAGMYIPPVSGNRYPAAQPDR